MCPIFDCYAGYANLSNKEQQKYQTVDLYMFDLKLIVINAIENVNIKRRLNRQQGKHLLRSKINKCKLTQLLIKMMRTLQRVRKPSASQDEKPKTCINFQFKLLGLMTMVNSDFNPIQARGGLKRPPDEDIC